MIGNDLFFFVDCKNITILNVTFKENFGKSNIFSSKVEYWDLFDVRCIRNNRRENANISDGSSCFVFSDFKRILMESIVISESFSDYTTTGIIFKNDISSGSESVSFT